MQEIKAFLARFPRPEAHQRDELPSETLVALNMLFSFLFHEHRDKIYTRSFFMNIFNKDFQVWWARIIAAVGSGGWQQERLTGITRPQFMIANTQLGKILLSVTVVDFSLGNTIPYFNNVTPLRPKHDELGSFESLDFVFDLTYKYCPARFVVSARVGHTASLFHRGRFYLNIDAELVFGKKARVSVTVLSLEGRARLGFRRTPLPHFTFAFVEEPVLHIEVDSLFQGRSFPQLNALILNQVHALASLGV